MCAEFSPSLADEQAISPTRNSQTERWDTPCCPSSRNHVESPGSSPAPTSVEKSRIAGGAGFASDVNQACLPASLQTSSCIRLVFFKCFVWSNQAARLEGSALIFSMEIPSGIFINSFSLHAPTAADSREQQTHLKSSQERKI